MHYFWHEKSPEHAANDLAELIRELPNATGAEEIVLLGYSMGADVLPPITRQLPADLLARVSRIVLMSPSHRVQLKFRFIGWLGFHTPESSGMRVAPGHRIPQRHDSDLLFRWDRRARHAGSRASPEVAQTEFLPGGHHYSSDYETLADRVLAEIVR